MTADGTNFIEWAMFILGAGLAFTGWRTIRKHHTIAEGREYKGKTAVRLGWLWIVLGILIILAIVLDIPLLKTFFRLFMEAPS